MIILVIYKYITTKSILPNRYKNIPNVRNNWPFENIYWLIKDPIKYMNNCQDKYGKIFKIKAPIREFIVITDEQLVNEFFSATEDTLSLNRMFELISISSSIFTSYDEMILASKIISTSVPKNPSVYEDDIRNIAELTVKSMGQQKKLSLISELELFVAKISIKCFIGINYTDKLYKHIANISWAMQHIVKSTFMLPINIAKLPLNLYIKYNMREIYKLLSSEIDLYRVDKTKNDSSLIRKAVDHENNLSNEIISRIIVGSLFVSSANTVIGCSLSLINILKHNMWDKIKESKDDILINSCVLESLRMNTHLLNVQRVVQKGVDHIGDYSVKEGDIVSLCGPLIMMGKK